MVSHMAKYLLSHFIGKVSPVLFYWQSISFLILLAKYICLILLAKCFNDSLVCLAGHTDVCMGVVCCKSDELGEKLRFLQFGECK